MKLSDVKSRRIGLMADSHGNLKATKKAIAVLRKEGAESLIHLGDFFDSLQNDPLSSLVSLLKDNGVLAVKGNNDHQIEKLLKDNSYEDGADREGVLSFIEDLPMIMVMKDLCFAHSLPFDASGLFTNLSTSDRRNGHGEGHACSSGAWVELKGTGADGAGRRRRRRGRPPKGRAVRLC